MKKVIAFDLDGTLAESKSAIEDVMAELLGRLLDKFQVCVISGGKFEQFDKQLIANLKIDPIKFEALHIMPTCGTRYYKYDIITKHWKMVYAEDFTEAEKKKITGVLNKALDELGFREKKTWGDIIEDRGSQITLSTLGQDVVDELGKEGIILKEAWDSDSSKKQLIRDFSAALLPEFEVRVGGLTSIDVTKPGIDKAYGMQRLMKVLDISKDEILFMGDRLAEGGNDYPVKEMGIDSVEVSSWKETAIIIEAITYLVR